MAPQIIYIILVLCNLVIAGYQHGEDKTGEHNMWINIIALAIMVALNYWGGFFDPLFQ
jgi:hypothetical protein